MGNVGLVFRWESIAPNETVGVFIHPYGRDEFVDFSIVPELHSNQPSGAVTVRAQMTEGETGVHVDGIAHTIWVKNTSVGPQPYIAATLVQFRQAAG